MDSSNAICSIADVSVRVAMEQKIFAEAQFAVNKAQQLQARSAGAANSSAPGTSTANSSDPGTSTGSQDQDQSGDKNGKDSGEDGKSSVLDFSLPDSLQQVFCPIMKILSSDRPSDF